MSGCPENSKNKPFDTTLDTGVECEKQEDTTVTSIRPHIAGPLTSMCSYEYGVVSPEGDAVAIKSLYCPETLNGEGNIFIYSFPDLELKLKIQGSYPDEFVGRVSTVIGQVEGVGTGPLVAFNWIERNAYPGTSGGADLYDINTGTLLTRIHSLNSWPGEDITFLDDFWVLTDSNESQIQLYDLHNLESETTPSVAIATHSLDEESPYNNAYTIGDADGDGLNDLLLEAAASYWFFSQEDAVYDQGIANAIYLPVRNTDADLSAPVSTPDWDGDGLEDIAIRDNSQTSPGDIRIVSPLSQWPLATYITSTHAESLGMHLARIDGFSGEGQEGLIVDKDINYMEPRSYYLLHPGGCGTIEIESVGDVLIQDELPIGYSTMWGQGQLLMFFPKQSGENTEHPIYLLTPEE